MVLEQRLQFGILETVVGYGELAGLADELVAVVVVERHRVASGWESLGNPEPRLGWQVRD